MIRAVGGVEIQSNANGSASAVVPGKSDEIYGMTDRRPDVDGRTDNERSFQCRTFTRRPPGCQLKDGAAMVRAGYIVPIGFDGAPLVDLLDPQTITGESLVTVDVPALSPSDHGLDTGSGRVAPTAHSGCPTNTGRSSSTSMRKAEDWTAFHRSKDHRRGSCRCEP